MEWEVSGRSWEVLLWPQIEAFLLTLTAFYFIFPFNLFSQVVPWFILVFFAKNLFPFLKSVGVLFPLLGEHTGFLGSSPLKGVQGNVPSWVTLPKAFCFPAVFGLLQGSGKREFAVPMVSMAPRWHFPLHCPIPGWIFLPWTFAQILVLTPPFPSFPCQCPWIFPTFMAEVGHLLCQGHQSAPHFSEDTFWKRM